MTEGEFKRLFAHELRELLTYQNAVCGFCQLLLADALTDVQRGHVDRILQVSDRLKATLLSLQQLAAD